MGNSSPLFKGDTPSEKGDSAVPYEQRVGIDPVKYGVMWQKVQDSSKAVESLEQNMDRRFVAAEAILAKQFERVDDNIDSRFSDADTRIKSLEDTVRTLVTDSDRTKGGISAVTTIFVMFSGLVGYLLSSVFPHKGN